MWWQDFHFLRPYWLIGLILPVLIYLQSYSQQKAESAWSKVCDENLLDFLLIKSNGEKRKWPMISAVVTVLFLVVALAGPTWSKKSNPALSVENPVMIMLNMSGDMWQKDVSPSRIERAKYVIKDLVKTLKNTESGLIVYSKEPFMITPLTEDAAIIDNLLPALEMNIMPENGDRLDRAIDLAVERMQKAALPSGNIVVLTANVGERFDAALESASKAAAAGYDVDIVNMSSQNNDKLKMVAEKGRGLYISYNKGLDLLIKKINDITAKEIKQSQNMQTVWNDMGWYFLWLPALLLLGYFRRGLLVIVVMFLLFGQPVQASWFLNDNQEALKNFKEQNYGAAAEKFTDTQWKASAAYKSGDYDAAFKNFAKGNDVTALYNQGNALAKGGKIDEAIKKYEEVLQQQPDFEDAKFNLEYLKKQQKQNNQNQSKNNDNKQQQKQQQSEQQKQQQSEQQKQQQSEQQKQQQSEQQKQQQSEQQNQQQQSEQQNQQQQSEQQKQQQSEQQKQQQSEQQKQQQSEQQNQQQQSEQQNQQQQSEQQNQQQQSEQQKQQQQSEQQNQQQQSEQQNQQPEEQKSVSIGASDKQSSAEREKIRARMQKFRKIPEDKGGLLRAFIKKEYAKKRYEK